MLCGVARARSADSSEAHRVDDTDVGSARENASAAARHSRGRRHGHPRLARLFHLHSEVWCPESSPQGTTTTSYFPFIPVPSNQPKLLMCFRRASESI